MRTSFLGVWLVVAASSLLLLGRRTAAFSIPSVARTLAAIPTRLFRRQSDYYYAYSTYAASSFSFTEASANTVTSLQGEDYLPNLSDIADIRTLINGTWTCIIPGFVYNSTTYSCHLLKNIIAFDNNTGNPLCNTTAGYLWSAHMNACRKTRIIGYDSNNVSVCAVHYRWSTTQNRCRHVHSNVTLDTVVYNYSNTTNLTGAYFLNTSQIALLDNGQSITTTTSASAGATATGTSCPGDQTYNTTTQACQCAGNQAFNTTSQTCQCPGAAYFDESQNVCSCAPNAFNSYGVCMCHTGAVFDLVSVACLCPTGMTLQGSICKTAVTSTTTSTSSSSASSTTAAAATPTTTSSAGVQDAVIQSSTSSASSTGTTTSSSGTSQQTGAGGTAVAAAFVTTPQNTGGLITTSTSSTTVPGVDWDGDEVGILIDMLADLGANLSDFSLGPGTNGGTGVLTDMLQDVGYTPSDLSGQVVIPMGASDMPSENPNWGNGGAVNYQNLAAQEIAGVQSTVSPASVATSTTATDGGSTSTSSTGGSTPTDNGGGGLSFNLGL